MPGPDPPSPIKGITVEASCFVFFFAFSVYSLGAQRLLIQKTCSPDVRPGIEDLCNATDAMGEAADINTVRNVLGEALPGIVVFIAGSWRDATGLCRPLILFTCLAQFLAAGAFLLASTFWSVSPWPASVFESTLGGLSGGRQMINLAAICYISNRTTPQQRTFRLTLFIVSMTAGLSLSTAASGYILVILGYKYFFGTIMALYLVAATLALIFIKEEQSKLKKGTKWLNASKLLIVFKPKPNRAVIWLMIVNSWLIYTTQCGELNVILYFLEKAFGFTITRAGFFLAYLMTMNFISTIVLSPLLIKVFKWSDFTIGVVGNICTIIAVLGIAFTKSVTLLYIFAAVDVMRFTVLTVQKSIITKCLPDDVLGTYWSFVAIGESVVPMLTLPIYDIVFKMSLSTLPGAHYFVSAVFSLIAFVNICFAKQLFKTDVNTEKAVELKSLDQEVPLMK